MADADLVGELRVPRDGRGGRLGGDRDLRRPGARQRPGRVRRGAATADGLYGYVVADPTDLDSTADQLRRYLDAPGVLGVKVHGEWSGTPTTAPGDDATCSTSWRRFGRPVKIHNTGDGWDDALARDRAPPSARCRS